MTGYTSKRKVALDKLDDDDIQVYAQPVQPPQRTWVGLTETEIDEWTPEIHGVIRSIEAKLKELNHG
jgi:hypothetical protein